MLPAFRVRRARRADYEAIKRLVSERYHLEERANRRRFRKLVSSLIQDLYLAERGRQLCGLVLIAYVREVDGSASAIVRDLILSAQCPGEVRGLLLDCAERRARNRGVARLEVLAEAVGQFDEAAVELAGRGYVTGGTLLRLAMPLI